MSLVRASERQERGDQKPIGSNDVGYIYNLFISKVQKYTRTTTSQGSHPFALNHSSLFSLFVYCSRHLFNARFSSLHLNTTIQPCSFAHFANAVIERRMNIKIENVYILKDVPAALSSHFFNANLYNSSKCRFLLSILNRLPRAASFASAIFTSLHNL